MTQFRVLPVRRGDAFLLVSPRGDYLVDGGELGNGVPKMLDDRKARKLRAVICTSACSERLGGVLELMEAGHTVSEYWLPQGLELLIEMGRRFNGDWEGWLHLLGNGSDTPSSDTDKGWARFVQMLPQNETQRRLEGAAVLIGLGMVACLGWSPYSKLSRKALWGEDHRDSLYGLSRFFNWTLELLTERAASRWRENKTAMSRIINRLGWRLFHGGGPEDLALLCGRLLLAESELLPGGDERGTRAVVQGLAMASMTAALLTKNSAKLRFFRHTGQLEEHLVPRHPVRCINGVEVNPLIGLAPTAAPQTILHEARALSGHREGLVFQYGDSDCSVLFCSDTRMTFLNKIQRLELDRPTVITAPRQGSYIADRAYNHIESSVPKKNIWVRTHNPGMRKVSSFFTDQEHKACLHNCQDLTLQEILL
ncbi:hypothetical protein OAN24_06110, partial [Pseudodesulfovibrio sp.]|nr:hypothetical protein [Pseudodesulfovibrio sp.]